MTATVAAEVVLEARGVSAGYGKRPVLHEMDISIERGKVVLLLGPNGAGKSTTLLTLSGELAPMAGQVLVNGSPTRAPLSRRAREGLGLVPEERSVIKTLTCRDNLRLGNADLDRALDIFPELKRLINVMGGLLSGGEQQMLSLARALSAQPKVLLADELSLGLAPMMVERLLATVRAAADDGCAILLVEQHVRRAMTIADEVHVLQQGHITLSGSASDIAERISEVEEQYLSTRPS